MASRPPAQPSAPAQTTQNTPPSTRYLCVHGHFYQPPRENPWLESIEVQDSAAPYHDWNERITSECYAPNGASRIQNDHNQIVRILNNYARISFNFGPTLLSWLEAYAPRTYRMIQDADATSVQRHSGHGSAIAQVYNHIIMPLASERDARTQIRWGISDFEHRFGRKPEGMWLAETAVSRHVLDLMAQEGIQFTILAPHQCARVRKLSESQIAAVAAHQSTSSSSKDNSPHRRATDPQSSMDAGVTDQDLPTQDIDATASDEPWQETHDASVDTTRTYRIQLDEGRSIAVFFYNGPISRAIAFEGLLNSGEAFAGRLLSGLRDDKAPDEPQLVHVATDGESYGHHHKHGEMTLSYALHFIEDNNLAMLTNYGEYLSKFPPQWDAEVVDNSSWSCSHGIERWRSDCGCNGGRPGCNQQWRGPLREALDLLRDRTAPLAEAAAHPLLKDLWAARDAYIDVVLDRSPSSIDRFLSAHATHDLTPEERVTVLELLELERHAQLMYTSCGWFFDEISGIETVQVIAYAGRVLQLARKLFSSPPLFGGSAASLEAEFLNILSRAQSNDPTIGNGADIYRRFVTTGGHLDLEHVGAHYAISSMFSSYPDTGDLFCFDVHRRSYELLTSGRGRVALGRAALRSRITEENEEICFAVLHLGDHNLSAAVRRFAPSDAHAWNIFLDEAHTAIRRADLPGLIRLIDGFFGGTIYSLTSLFADEQHLILQSILDQTLSEVESSLMRIYEEHSTLLDFLGEVGVSAPPALALTAGFAINAGLRQAIEADTHDSADLARLLRRATIDHIALDTQLLSYTADKRMKRAMVQLELAFHHQLQLQTQAAQQTFPVLNETLALAESLRTLPMEVNIWQAQNIWNDLLRRTSDVAWPPEFQDGFRKLGLALNIAVDDLVVEEGVRTF